MYEQQRREFLETLLVDTTAELSRLQRQIVAGVSVGANRIASAEALIVELKERAILQEQTP